jgi:hypothetical protein
VWTCSALAVGAEIGAVVSLKVDHRTHSRAQGLLVVVHEMKKVQVGYCFAVITESSLMMELRGRRGGCELSRRRLYE